MRRFGIFSAIAIILAFAVAAWAVDPWKGKPVDQWDQNDITKILTDSPWVKKVQIEASWVKGKQSSSSPSAAGDQGPSGPPQAIFMIRWNSARTPREALYRQALLGNEIKQDEYDKAMNEQVDDYQILIVGSDMTPFQDSTEASLTTAGYLMSKKTKDKIPPKGVVVQRGPDQKVSVVVFSFFKKSLNGQETVPEDEKSMDFYLTSPVKLHCTFDVSKMVDAKGKDL